MTAYGLTKEGVTGSSTRRGQLMVSANPYNDDDLRFPKHFPPPPLDIAPMPLILEGLVTTQDAQGVVNLAPMGPIVDRDLTRLTLRPFRTSQTYRNLKQTREGVFHVTDDVELLAHAAIGDFPQPPEYRAAAHVKCPLLADACRWLEFRVELFDDNADRTTIECAIIQRSEGRPFFGFNRAKHAVVEAAILATRVGIQPADEIREEMSRLAVIVGKTAGEQEERAFRYLREQTARRLVESGTP